MSVEEKKALRFNEGKTDWTLLDYPSIEPAVKVMTFGAQKYDRDNWRLPCDDPRQHLQSAMRHLISIIQGEEFDLESGERHSGHVISNMMMYNYHTKEIKNDNISSDTVHVESAKEL